MKVLLSQGVTNPVGKALNVSWEEFIKLVKKYSIAREDESNEEKRRAPWFSAAEYKDNHRKRNNLVGLTWLIVADLDTVTHPEKVEQVLSKWEYIAWTTWNSTPLKPRWRIVLPVEGGVWPERFGPLVRRILDPLKTLAKIDDRSYMPEQLWFLPWHKQSQAKNHTIWTHDGSWVRDNQLIQVDFTGVKLAHKPEEIDEGERNSMLVLRLSEPDALRSESRDDLRKIAEDWNSKLSKPMRQKEVLDVVRKKWNWMQTNEGLMRRADAWKQRVTEIPLPDIGVGLLSNSIRTAKLPDSLIGDFLYPGATMVTAKMKEGKSFLAMQLAMSLATGTPFLSGPSHPGFTVRARKKAVIIAGEDTAGGISSRFMGSITSGHLPQLLQSDDVKIVFNDDLDTVRSSNPKAPGLFLFESLIERWYNQGYRVIAVDPLRVLESAFHVTEYPGTVRGMNAHARDFQTMRYYTKVAQNYEDLCILISMHHGKNKRDHDANDPGDMIAGTTGYGAGAITTISILPAPKQLTDDDGPKRRELYVHGRHTREDRLLIEQDERTGIWKCLGRVSDTMISDARLKYFKVIERANGMWVSAEAIGKETGTRPDGVHKILRRACRDRTIYKGKHVVTKKGPGGGYRLM